MSVLCVRVHQTSKTEEYVQYMCREVLYTYVHTCPVLYCAVCMAYTELISRVCRT